MASTKPTALRADEPKANRQPRLARPGQKLLTLSQASAETGIPATSLRDLHFRGHLPVVRLPGDEDAKHGQLRRWWIRRSDLEQLIERSVDPGGSSR